MPHLRGKGTGDELVRVNVEIPRRLTERQRELCGSSKAAACNPLRSAFRHHPFIDDFFISMQRDSEPVLQDGHGPREPRR